jgi:hypothetical protein
MQSAQRDKFTADRLKLRKLEKPKRWSHQAELDRLKGKAIAITGHDGSSVEGTLLEADQFTLRVSTTTVEGKTAIMTFFKHALLGYAAVGV